MKNAYAQDHDDSPYRELQQHLDRQPVGFPPSGSGADIRLLKHIFTPKEARIAACLSHEPGGLDKIFPGAKYLVSSVGELEERLTAMVKKGGLEFRHEKGRDLYANTPLVVGIYELQAGRLTPEFIKDFKEADDVLAIRRDPMPAVLQLLGLAEMCVKSLLEGVSLLDATTTDIRYDGDKGGPA